MIKLIRGLRPRMTRLVVTFLGVITMSSASFFMMGYLAGYPAFYTFPKGMTPVALPTSILFFVLGTAIYLISASRDHAIDEHLETDESRIKRLEQELEELKARNHKST